MVGKYLLTLGLCTFLLFSCDVFLQTPFDTDLVNFQTSTSLKTIAALDDNVSYYRLIVVGDWICLILIDATPQHAIIFNCEDLSLVKDIGGSFENLFMEAANGDILIGNMLYDAANETFSTQNFFSPGHYGFSYSSLNYEVYRDDDNLIIESSDSAYANLSTITLTMSNNYRLRSLFLDTHVTDPTKHILLLIFENDWGRYEAVFCNPTSLPAPLSTYPFGQKRLFLQPADNMEYHYTEAGYLFKGHGDYYLYNYEGKQQSKLASTSYMEDIYIAYDKEGRYYYKFNPRTKVLTKYSVWWQ